MNFIIDVLRGIIFRVSAVRTDNLGGYIITRPGLRKLDDRLCNYWR